MTYIPLSQIDTFLPADANGKATKPAPREENNDCYAHLILIRTSSDPAKASASRRRYEALLSHRSCRCLQSSCSRTSPSPCVPCLAADSVCDISGSPQPQMFPD